MNRFLTFVWLFLFSAFMAMGAEAPKPKIGDPLPFTQKAILQSYYRYEASLANIVFSQPSNTFGIAEGETDSMFINLASSPGGTPDTVVISDSFDIENLISYYPDTVIFDNINYATPVKITITAALTCCEVQPTRTVQINIIGSADDHFKDIYLRERDGDIMGALVGDPHVGTDAARSSGARNGMALLLDYWINGTSSQGKLNETFSNWDFMIVLGDITGHGFQYISGNESNETAGLYPGRGIGWVWVNSFTQAQRNKLWTIPGNHDSGDSLRNVGLLGGNKFAAMFFDPWGLYPATSGITSRAFHTVRLRQDIGYFDVGNIRHILLWNRNDAEKFAGREDVSRGHPAGVYSKQQIEVFDSLINVSNDANIKAFAHHNLSLTTAYTALGEEECLGSGGCNVTLHGNHGDPGVNIDWGRGSFASVTWDELGVYTDPTTYRTFDGLGLDSVFHAYPRVSFKQSLLLNGKQMYWYGAHTHGNCSAYDSHNGREMIFAYKNIGGANCGTISKYHGDNYHQYVRRVDYYEGQDVYRLSTYTLETTTLPNDMADPDVIGMNIRQGWNDDLTQILPLQHPFSSAVNLEEMVADRSKCNGRYNN